MERKTTILTITGSDSTGGSGIQADIKTITMLGAYAATAITSVTAQESGRHSAIIRHSCRSAEFANLCGVERFKTQCCEDWYA